MTLERFKMSSGSVMAYKEQFIEIYKAPNFSGSKMLWLRVDDVVVPSHIFIFDRQLACKFVKEEDTTNKIQFNNEKDLVVYLYTGQTDDSSKTPFFEPGYFDAHGKNSSHISQCSFLTEIDFGKVAAGVGKDITLVIQNLNPIPIGFERIKKRSIDDLKVTLEKVTDKFGNTVQPVWDGVPGVKQMLNSWENSQKMGLLIQPFEQVHIKFEINSMNEEQRDS